MEYSSVRYISYNNYEFKFNIIINTKNKINQEKNSYENYLKYELLFFCI